MPNLLMLKGLPGSGKSQFAKSLKDYNRVSMDDLIQMLDDGNWTKHNEKVLQKVHRCIIWDLMTVGVNIVVDDTNFHEKHLTVLKQMVKHRNELAKGFSKYTFKVHFVDTPLEECIKRDLQRQHSVGKDVIMKMYNQYLKPPAQDQEWNPDLPTCVIVDIDGTVAKMVNRGPYDWAKVGDDEPKREIIELVQMLAKEHKIVFMSGRDSTCRSKTWHWLVDHKVMAPARDGGLYMRPEGDQRKDSIVKQELYEEHVKGKYNVQLVLDDRDSVVAMWRSLGLTCLQVAEGDF